MDIERCERRVQGLPPLTFVRQSKGPHGHAFCFLPRKLQGEIHKYLEEATRTGRNTIITLKQSKLSHAFIGAVPVERPGSGAMARFRFRVGPPLRPGDALREHTHEELVAALIITHAGIAPRSIPIWKLASPGKINSYKFLGKQLPDKELHLQKI